MAETTKKHRPTPTTSPSNALKVGGFETICDALEYAAKGETGYNFFNLRGEVTHALPYSVLRDRAIKLARKLAANFHRGDRIAIIAETSPEFVSAFFACQYAGLVPAPMPMPVNLGGKDGYINQITQMIQGAGASAAIGPEALGEFLVEAAASNNGTQVLTFDQLHSLDGDAEPEPFGPDDYCYIQYSSGSTSAPKGVIGTQRSVNSNLTAIASDGMDIKVDDRAISWLPLYHDMGLIGFLLTPLVAQISVDFLATSDFVRRPLMWLRIMTDQRSTITYSPSFGYDLTAKRSARAEPGSINLERVRVAGIGGDMVRPEALEAFAEAFAGSGFKRSAFAPSYGMAEATLAISFPNLNEDFQVDTVDMRHLTRSGIAQPASALTSSEHSRRFVLCGAALKGHNIEVRDDDGNALEERQVGRIFITGPSLTPGYFSDAEASDAMYHGDWLDTGDMGYMLDGQIVITGRAKDLIIINGRNIWPQDIEWAVEKVAGIRGGGVAAFAVDENDSERIVVIAERRGMDADALSQLKRDVSSVIQNAVGATADVHLVRPHSMVVTSSGKLSRARVKKKFLDGVFEADAKDSIPARSVVENRV